MIAIGRYLGALLALLFVLAGPGSGQAAEPGAALAAVSAAPAAVNLPQTNAEIRQWYNDQVAVIPALNEQWVNEGLSAEERARRAHEIRHNARLQAREFMPDKQEVADLQARDLQKYGNPDGPTFDQLVEANRAKGMTGDAVYEAIINSSNRTNAEYNQRFGVTPSPPSPAAVSNPPQ